MNFRTQIPLKENLNQIDYNSKIILFGSCFTKNIGDKLEYFKFQSNTNPFGILFHPLAIEQLISNSINKKVYTEKDIFFLNERWHTYDAHSDLSDVSKEKLLSNLIIPLSLRIITCNKLHMLSLRLERLGYTD